jgi:photosystem II stability/assembly factor-like uncharacterized protein
MRVRIPLAILAIGIAGLILLWPGQPPPIEVADQAVQPDDPPTSGPDWQRKFFAEWHRPYGAELPAEVQAAIWEEIERLPSESEGRPVDSWTLVGPSGMTTSAGALYSGRVLDLDALNGPGTVIGSASGGLWRYDFVFPVPLTDDVTSQWIGTVAIDPNDEDTMLIGTGEFWIHNGTGLWKSTDGGETWVHKPMSPEPVAFFRVRYGSNGTTVHAATRNGYYRSTDGGETWTRIQFTGAVTDIAVVPSASGPDVLYMTRWGEGLYVSFDEGLNWYQAGNPVIPTSDVSRGAVAVCESNPGVIYVAFTHLENVGDDSYHRMEGIYKTTNYGYTWTDVSPPDNYMGNQGWYNNVISVCPTDPNLVYAGGVSLLRSTNGGASWQVVNDPHLHVDYHAMQWHPNGIYFWTGHDGGWSFSNNRGFDGSWTSGSNYLPITQFTEIDAMGLSWASAIVAGGSQDNGICRSEDGGSSWVYNFGGDGGGIEVGWGINEMWFALGVFGGDLTFRRFISYDGGETRVDISEGILDSGTWYPAMRRDGDGRNYTHSGNYVHSRAAGELSWQDEQGYGFGAGNVSELTVSPVPGQPVLWVCLATDTVYQLYVKDGDYWYNRKYGLPEEARVRKVAPHPTNSNRAYALMNGLGTPGEKIFLTLNRGNDWINITGDLPNVPLADLVVHPDDDDILFVGSEFGFYRTVDGGQHWMRWNNGCPEAVVVTEMKTVNMRAFYQGFHVVAATYGRSIWRRDVSGYDEPTGTGEMVASAVLGQPQAVPNPFNPATEIRFDLARDERVRVTIHDVAGRVVRSLHDGSLGAGPQRLVWNGRDDVGRPLASGAYLVRIEAAGEGVTHKVLLSK